MANFSAKLESSKFAVDARKKKWIAFNGMYDFAFMQRLLTQWKMPATLSEHQYFMDMFLPNRIDLRTVVQEAELNPIWRLECGMNISKELEGLRSLCTNYIVDSETLTTLRNVAKKLKIEPLGAKGKGRRSPQEEISRQSGQDQLLSMKVFCRLFPIISPKRPEEDKDQKDKVSISSLLNDKDQKDKNEKKNDEQKDGETERRSGE